MYSHLETPKDDNKHIHMLSEYYSYSFYFENSLFIYTDGLKFQASSSPKTKHFYEKEN